MLLRWIPKVRSYVALLMIPALLIACTANLQIQTPTPNAETNAPTIAVGYSFSGTVARGETFTQNLASNLTFQLIPIQEGWEIWVGDPVVSTAVTDNFAMPVTPPFSGINARQIEGWHFRNSDNSGPNDAGEKNVNAPQESRTFCFVATSDDFQTALDAMATGLPSLADAVANDAFLIHSGTLTITNYTLGNLLLDQKAWFEQMEFTVTLNLDQPCALF